MMLSTMGIFWVIHAFGRALVIILTMVVMERWVFGEYVTVRRHPPTISTFWNTWTTQLSPTERGAEEIVSTKWHRGRYDDFMFVQSQSGGLRRNYRLRYKPLSSMSRAIKHQQSIGLVNSTGGGQQQLSPAEAATTPITATITTTEQQQQQQQEQQNNFTVQQAVGTMATDRQTTTTVEPTASSVPIVVVGQTASHIMKPPRPSSSLDVPANGGRWRNRWRDKFMFGSPIEANLIVQQTSGRNKSQSKGFLSLFEVIKFENTKCSMTINDIRTIDGVCYHEFECKSLGGIPTESCAEGVGVCCIFVNSCGDVTNQQVLYFESPNYPNAVKEMMVCVLIVNLRKNVQQLRLDFIMFELNRPTNGDCLEDQFIVSGQNPNFVVPILCGINTGQHIYLHVGESFENKIYLSFFAKVPSGGRSFNIKITQLEDKLSPDGCLQYFADTEGIVKSFNYDLNGVVVEKKEATYLNNLNYVICMERARDSCSIKYYTEQLAGDQLDFQIINKDEGENDLSPDGQAGVGIFHCPDDFIGINQIRLCGERFNDGTDVDDSSVHATVKDFTPGPIVLPVRSDAEYVGRGFRLIFRQEKCL